MALILLAAVVPAAEQLAPLDPAEHEKATAAILCDCGCHPQAVRDCACGRAAEMRREIADLMTGAADGVTRNADEVIALYVARHGEQILVAPPAHGFNLVAWLGPFFALILAVTGIGLLVRRLSARSAATPAPAGGAAAPLDPADPYLARLQRELEERQ